MNSRMSEKIYRHRQLQPAHARKRLLTNADHFKNPLRCSFNSAEKNPCRSVPSGAVVLAIVCRWDGASRNVSCSLPIVDRGEGVGSRQLSSRGVHYV